MLLKTENIFYNKKYKNYLFLYFSSKSIQTNFIAMLCTNNNCMYTQRLASTIFESVVDGYLKYWRLWSWELIWHSLVQIFCILSGFLYFCKTYITCVLVSGLAHHRVPSLRKSAIFLLRAWARTTVIGIHSSVSSVA